MSNVSVADILKIHGNWIGSGQFTELVAKRLKIGERQAYRLIKKDKQVLRIVLPDRTSLYGLAEFGLPTEVRPSKFGLFEWLNKRAERNKQLEEQIQKETWARYYTYCELVAKFYPEMQAMKDWADIQKKHRKELGLE